MKRIKSKRLSYNSRLLIIAVSAVLSILPAVFVFSNSFMGATEAAARYTSLVTPHSSLGSISGGMHYMEMGFLPEFLSISGWREAIIEQPANLRYVINSMILTVPVVIGQLIIAPLAAYSFERAKGKHKDMLFFTYIIVMLLPMQALLVPHFIAANYLGINESYLAIILPAVFAPFSVFLIRQQMKGFEKEIIEAAKVDGASELCIFLKIMLPNIKPALTALAVLAFAEAWNVVDQAVVFIKNPFSLPMSVHLSVNLTGNIGIAFTLSSLFMIPALIVDVYGEGAGNGDAVRIYE